MSESLIEAMSVFFNKRAETYDDHMLKDLDLNQFYEEIAQCLPSGSQRPRVEAQPEKLFWVP